MRSVDETFHFWLLLNYQILGAKDAIRLKRYLSYRLLESHFLFCHAIKTVLRNPNYSTSFLIIRPNLFLSKSVIFIPKTVLPKHWIEEKNSCYIGLWTLKTLSWRRQYRREFALLIIAPVFFYILYRVPEKKDFFKINCLTKLYFVV